MGTSYGYKPDIPANSILLSADRHNPKFRSDSYNALFGQGKNTSKKRINNGTIDVPGLDAADSNNTQRFTLAVWVEVNSYNTGYAWHPANKWNSASTNSATIVLYAFQDYRSGGGGTVGDGLGNDDHGKYGFYFHRYDNGGWSGITIPETDSKLGGIDNRNNFPRKNMFVFTYDVDQNNSQPKMYVNGQYHNQGSSAPNGIGNYSYSHSDLYIWTNYPSDASANINGVTWIQVYDKMISDDEVSKLYNHTKKKHGY